MELNQIIGYIILFAIFVFCLWALVFIDKNPDTFQKYEKDFFVEDISEKNIIDENVRFLKIIDNDIKV